MIQTGVANSSLIMHECSPVGSLAAQQFKAVAHVLSSEAQTDKINCDLEVNDLKSLSLPP